MDKLVIDLEELKKRSEEELPAFFDFAKKVKQIPLSRFDEIAHPIVKEITSKIDCTQCGNCCRHQEPGVSEDEIERLSTCKNIPVKEFKDQFVAWDKEGISFLFQKPCTFLHGNICSIYTQRPGSCADFPGLHRPRLKWRIKQVEENYSICPIVFNVVEKLKEIL
jgi:Fe-S-cluster containining protein